MGVVYRSTNGGARFNSTEFGEVFEESGRVRGLLVRDGVLYAVQTTSSVYASSDDGDTFEQIGVIDPAFQGPPPPHEGSHDMGGFGIDTGYWYLAESNGRMFAIHHLGSLYRSLDRGATWEMVAEGQF